MRYASLSILIAASALIHFAPATSLREEFPRQVAPVSERTNSIGMVMALVPKGKFRMGSPVEELGRLSNEGPIHTVEISRDYWMGKYEVTRGQFSRFVLETGYVTEAERDVGGGFGLNFGTGKVEQMSGLSWRDPRFPEFSPSDDHPVMLVSWSDAEAFCKWLSRREGRPYRLPTEAEWEYAARGGAPSPYHFGPDSEKLAQFANVADADFKRSVPKAENAERWSDGFPFTAPVGSFKPNPFGLHDMHGNVWEWCSDWHQDDYYRTSPGSDPHGPTTGLFRVIRGGGWLNGAARNRAAQRIYFQPRFRYCLLSGFRVVMDGGSANAAP